MTTRKILVATPTAPIAIDVNSSAAVSVTLSGARGANGYGVPVGGDAGAVLAKSASGDYLTSWLTTTAFGRGLLAIADATGLRSAAGLANVDNTADLSKPVSTAQALAISAAVAAEATIRGSADTSEAGTRAAADTALDGRLDVLEEDHITATAVASGLAGKLAIASNLGDLNNAATARTNLGLGSLATQSGTFSGTSSGTNTGDQTITLTGDVTGSGTGSFAATVATNAITNAKAAQMAAGTIKGNNTGATANPADLTAAQVRGVLALPTSTVAGRVALYTDTAGSQGQTSALFENAGNVGIGTTTPSKPLEISNTLPILRLTDSDGGLADISGSGGHMSLQADPQNTQTGSRIALEVDGTERIRINSSGNVGIGTTNPGQKLDVAGNVQASGSANFAYNGVGNTGNVRIDSSGIGSSGRIYGFSGASALGFLLDSGGTSYLNGGNVGIGTTTPSKPLEISNTLPILRLTDSDGGLADISGSGGHMSLQADPQNTQTGSRIALEVDGTERIRINSSGNVGIGTTSPRVKLDVAGPVAVGSYTVATVPSAALCAGQIIYVSNESGGATLAFSDGTNWRRTSDNAILS